MPHTNRVDLLPNGGWDPRVLVLANSPLVQVFSVITTRYLVLVDTLINPTTAARALDLLAPWRTGRALLVVNTHADYDHAWGNQIFAGSDVLAPAPIFALRRCAEVFAEPATAALLADYAAAEPEIFDDVRLTPPTVLFDDCLTIDGGDLTLELFATPGHTPDHLSVWIPEIATLLPGDAAELPFPYVARAGDLPALRTSLTRLTAFPAETALYCHAPVTAGPQLIRDNLAYYEGLEAACRDTLRRGSRVAAAADAELPDLIGCRFADITPSTPLWAGVAGADHPRQCRLMLDWLTTAG